MTQELPMPPRTQAIQMVQDKVQRVGNLRSQTYWFSCIYSGILHGTGKDTVDIFNDILFVGFFMEQKIFEMTKHNSVALKMMRWMPHGHMQLQ